MAELQELLVDPPPDGHVNRDDIPPQGKNNCAGLALVHHCGLMGFDDIQNEELRRVARSTSSLDAIITCLKSLEDPESEVYFQHKEHPSESLSDAIDWVQSEHKNRAILHLRVSSITTRNSSLQRNHYLAIRKRIDGPFVFMDPFTRSVVKENDPKAIRKLNVDLRTQVVAHTLEWSAVRQEADVVELDS